MGAWLRSARKSVLAGLGTGATLGVEYEQYLPERARPWVAVVVAVATAFGVYHIPNETP